METTAGGYDAYACPSFSSYSCDRLPEIAVQAAAAESNSNNDGGGEEFEFAPPRQENDDSVVHSFTDGHNGSVFPVFNRNMLLNHGVEFGESRNGKELESSGVLIPFRKLLIQEREADNPPSCSSSEADELENIPAGTFCVWRPRPADQPSPSRCCKSRSTGSTSKRWSFRDFLRRSNSEGKDSFVFLTPKRIEEKSASKAPKQAKPKAIRATTNGGGGRLPSAHEALYIRNRAVKEGDRKKSYLPYKKDIVGFFFSLDSTNH